MPYLVQVNSPPSLLLQALGKRLRSGGGGGNGDGTDLLARGSMGWGRRIIVGGASSKYTTGVYEKAED